MSLALCALRPSLLCLIWPACRQARWSILALHPLTQKDMFVHPATPPPQQKTNTHFEHTLTHRHTCGVVMALIIVWNSHSPMPRANSSGRCLIKETYSTVWLWQKNVFWGIRWSLFNNISSVRVDNFQWSNADTRHFMYSMSLKHWTSWRIHVPVKFVYHL